MPGRSDWHWIRESEVCSEAELPELVRSFTQPEDKAVAFYVDRFQAANRGFVPALLESVENLLELRIFRPDAEFLARRSALGAKFSWRIADDNAFREKSGEADFKDTKKRHMIETTQLLDISPDYIPYRKGERDAFGCRRLRSSVGGHYALPLDERAFLDERETHRYAPNLDDKEPYGYVRLVNYVSYGENGIAGIADFRIADLCLVGFKTPSKGGDSA